MSVKLCVRARSGLKTQWEAYVFARDSVDNIIGRGAKKFSDDGELVDVILSGEQGLAINHLRKNAPGTPDIDFDVVLLPGEHDLRSAVVSRRNVASHLRILKSGKTKIANLEIAILVDQDVTGLQVSVDHAGGMYVFQAALENRLLVASILGLR